MDTRTLVEIVGSDGVLTGGDVHARSVSWADHGPCQALAIVRPTSTEQVSRVLAACNAARQPVVTMGGLTGLVRGCVAGPGEVALSLERMNRIESIDPVGRTMTVQAGVPLQTVQEEAEKQGLLYPVDFGARGSAHIGGSVATNAGGNGVIRYGMTRESVLGLEAVLADGTVIPAMNRMIKNNAAYDLKQLFIGTEGTLGVVTRLVLRLRERPVCRRHDPAEAHGRGPRRHDECVRSHVERVLSARHVAARERDGADGAGSPLLRADRGLGR